MEGRPLGLQTTVGGGHGEKYIELTTEYVIIVKQVGRRDIVFAEAVKQSYCCLRAVVVSEVRIELDTQDESKGNLFDCCLKRGDVGIDGYRRN